MSTIGAAYSAGASAWAEGPNRVYRRLAELLVDFSPEPLGGRLVLDLGSGTGDGSRAARSAGMSAWQFIAPAVGVALVLGALATTVYNPVSALMQERSPSAA